MRIRTIKPEFWTSETIGKLSRNARLLFIGLWSLADDSGRLRGALPYLSGQLFPYDPDATPTNIAAWLGELCRLGMVRRYEAEGSTYIDIPKWLKHQKIEKPSKSRFPEFVEDSGNSRGIVGEPSVTDLGPRTMDMDLGEGPMEQGMQGEVGTAQPPAPAQDELLPTPAEPPKPAKKPAALPDSEWMAALKSNPAYDGISVEREWEKCRLWCETKRKTFSRARLLNWLNRIEKPLDPAKKQQHQFFDDQGF